MVYSIMVTALSLSGLLVFITKAICFVINNIMRRTGGYNQKLADYFSNPIVLISLLNFDMFERWKRSGPLKLGITWYIPPILSLGGFSIVYIGLMCVMSVFLAEIMNYIHFVQITGVLYTVFILGLVKV